jgi:hypothetical protein
VRTGSRTERGQRLAALCAASLATGAGCAVTEQCSPRIVTPTAEVLNAPDTLAIGGKELVLSAYLWRDFMPVQSEKGSCLRGVFHVVTADSSSPPAGSGASFAWVIHQGRAWQTPLGGPSAQPPWGLDFTPADRGPRWGPGDSVDVVIGLSYLGQRHLLRASDQPIHQTQ